MPSDNEIKIRDMARLSLLENKVNDIQLKNLKMFPLVFFNGVKEVEIKYDLDAGKSEVEFEVDQNKLDIKYQIKRPIVKNFVEYKISIDETQENTHIQVRYKALEKAVRDIFWSSVKVLVYFNDKKVFDSGDNNV